MTGTFLGFERPGDLVGVRNLVGVVGVMDNVNPVVRAICAQVTGTVAVTPLFVRGQYGRDGEIAFRTLAGLASNPNLASVLLVGLERTTTEDLADRISRVRGPVEILVLQEEQGGAIDTVAAGVRIAKDLVVKASALRRSAVPASALRIGVECGGSDTTSGLVANPVIGTIADAVVAAGGSAVISETSEFLGAERVFAERALTPDVGAAFIDRVAALEAEAVRRGVDIRGTNPVPDNIRGGLTTIEEKALGAMAKAGSSPLVGVLDYGERVVGPGLHFMDTPAPAVESMTGLAAGGVQVILFATGVGNPIGNPVSPTIKITGNPATARRFKDHVDFDVCAVLEGGEEIEAAGARLVSYLLDIASGTLTSSEVLRQEEIAISRFEPSI